MSTARRVLAISPHLDDAALSDGAALAELAAHGADVHVVTLFAGTPTEPLSTVVRAFHTTCGLPEDVAAVAVRIEEDRAMFDDLPFDRDALLGELSREVNRILVDGAPDLVLTCAAIGDHLDHRLTTALGGPPLGDQLPTCHDDAPADPDHLAAGVAPQVARHRLLHPPRSACSGPQTLTGLPSSTRTPWPEARELPLS